MGISKLLIPFVFSLSIYTNITPTSLVEVGEHDFPTVKKIEVEATFYTSTCKGCIGITKSGHNVKNTIFEKGYRVIAVDPNVIKLGTLVRVELADGQDFKAIASDVGSDIKDARIDVLVKTKKEAFRLGRQKAKITILEENK